MQLGGYELETAGVLKGGRKLWALARTPESFTLQGGDTVRAYLLLVTACGGTLATTAQCTSIRVVCNSTPAVAVGRGVGAARVPHRSEFSAPEVKEQLGLTIAPWSGFADRVKKLAACPVDERAADEYLPRIFILPDAVRAYLATDPSLGPLSSPTTSERAPRKAKALFTGAGKGSRLASAQGSAWGLLNSVTECVDCHAVPEVTTIGGMLPSSSPSTRTDLAAMRSEPSLELRHRPLRTLCHCGIRLRWVTALRVGHDQPILPQCLGHIPRVRECVLRS